MGVNGFEHMNKIGLIGFCRRMQARQQVFLHPMILQLFTVTRYSSVIRPEPRPVTTLLPRNSYPRAKPA